MRNEEISFDVSVSLAPPLGWSIRNDSDNSFTSEILFGKDETVVSVEFYPMPEGDTETRFEAFKNSVMNDLISADSQLSFNWLSANTIVGKLDGKRKYIYMFKKCDVLIYLSSNVQDDTLLNEVKEILNCITIESVSTNAVSDDPLIARVHLTEFDSF